MIQIVITEPEPGDAEGLRRILTDSGQIEVVGFARDGLEAAQMAIQTQPDALIAHAKLPALSGYDVCKLVNLAAPQVACLLLVDYTNAPSAIAQAMQAGARAVLSPDLSPQELVDTVVTCAQIKQIMQTNEYAIVTDPEQMPITIGLVSAKDGVGKTTLATNLSTLFAQRFPDSVVLVDMYAQLGDVSVSLNLQPRSSLIDLAAHADELDPQLVESALATHKSTLRVLPGSSTPQPVAWDCLSVSYIASLLGVLRRNYRFVFCDLPPMLWSSSLYVLARCQHILVVTNLFELTTIRDTANLITILLDAGYVSRQAIHLIVNRASAQDRFEIKDLEETVDMPVTFQIPNSVQTTVAAANKGEPFVLTQPNAHISRSLNELADLLLEASHKLPVATSKADVGQAA